MDLNIAAMSEGERAMLSNILDRGLSSLTQRQRADGTAAAAVHRLKEVLTQTPTLTTYTVHVLKRLAFAPRGLRLSGLDQQVLNSMAMLDEIVREGNTWYITDLGWARLWNSGTAATILADRYGTLVAPVGPVEA